MSCMWCPGPANRQKSRALRRRASQCLRARPMPARRLRQRNLAWLRPPRRTVRHRRSERTKVSRHPAYRPPAIKPRLQTRHRPTRQRSRLGKRPIRVRAAIRSLSQTRPRPHKARQLRRRPAQARLRIKLQTPMPRRRLNETTMMGLWLMRRGARIRLRRRAIPHATRTTQIGRGLLSVRLPTSALNCRCPMSRRSAPTIVHGARSNWPTARRPPSTSRLTPCRNGPIRPAGVAAGSDDAQLPVPAMPYYFGDDETETSAAE